MSLESCAPDDLHELTFEEALHELEDLTRRMEEGQLPLAELLKVYQRGTALLQYCHETLGEAGRQLEVLQAQEAEAGDEEGEGVAE